MQEQNHNCWSLASLIVTKNKHKGVFELWKWQNVTTFLRVVDIAKHLLDHTFLRKKMRDFSLRAFIRVCFSFISKLLSISDLPDQSLAITQFSSTSCIIFVKFSNISYKLHQCPKLGQCWILISVSPLCNTHLIVGFIHCLFSVVQMLTKQILQCNDEGGYFACQVMQAWWITCK